MALSRLTALELIRQPIYLVLTTACVVLTLLNPMLAIYQFGEEGKMARDSAFAYQFVIGLLMAAFSARHSLRREILNGTAAATLSKPVSRETFFLGKFAGASLVILAFSACALAATLLNQVIAVRLDDAPALVVLPAAPFLGFFAAGGVSYVTRRPFSSNAFVWLCLALAVTLAITVHRFTDAVNWRVVPASVLIAMALVVITALAAAVSTRLDAAPTIAVCAVLFLAGLVSDYMFGRAPQSAAAALAYMLIPNWQHFWVSDALTGGGTIPWSYVGGVLQYALLYLGGVLCLGIVSFRHMDLR